MPQSLSPSGSMPALPATVPVAVVGAGYAGLSAALSLRDEDVPVLVLEGSDRVGGRIWSRRTENGTLIDHGGQWVGPTQHRILAWAERFGCKTFPTWDTGDHLEAWHDGTVRRYRGSGPDEARGADGYAEATARIDELARRVEVSDPAAAAEAEAWDSETVHSFFERTVGCPDARRRLALAVQGVWAMEPREISLLHLLFYVAGAGGFAQLMDTRNAAQDARFHAGAQSPALAAADHLGAAVRLRCPVEAIDWSGESVRLTTTAGEVRAERVIVATPPPATAAIRFRPGLPTARARWLQRSVMGDVAKVHVVYPRPFWREDGLSGIASLYGEDAAGVVFDNSPPDGGAGVLVAFVYGDRLRRWSRGDDGERRACMLQTLTRLFGPAAAEPAEYVEKIWPHDPWVGGGYAANPAPGAWVAHGAAGWRAPCGPLHWAGTETSEVWNGYIDGAIRSGERAAREVLASLDQ
ncbi:flavin monoamine oxidase family protein [Amycolatopsis taiwanensis]|uniref:Monoamine oxidase n=1 Tax=Amycolatopsis taiwanensis TaxID=342230 RepID=A0A9W6VKI8_9PSEU|nr:NAD(P)/FAD-dependent oxidoreductase [Amycolatopsis taiwanensis]GLY69546.1 monoamine oxidase [Amycolatopsis taiwanensis]